MTKDNNNKNLTLTELKKLNKELDGRDEHTIMFGDTAYNIKIDKNFRQSKQHDMLTDLIDFFNEANNRGDVDLLDLATPYSSLLIIKHFTSLSVPDDIDEALEVLTALIDLNLFGEILEIMPEYEITKVLETLEATVSRLNTNIEEVEKEMEEASELVENASVKEMIDGNDKE